MPRYELPGQQGRKGNYRRRLRRPTVGVVPALLLFYSQREYGERKSHISTPSDMLRSRAFLKIRFTYSIAGNIRRQGRSMTVRTFRLPLTLFNTFNIFPRTGVRTSFANHSIHRQQRRRTVPRAFFLVLINTEECTAIVETDRDFADRNPPPHSSPKHPEPFAILIGDGPLRNYRHLRLLRRRGTRKARKAVYRPSPRPIGHPRFYFVL